VWNKTNQVSRLRASTRDEGSDRFRVPISDTLVVDVDYEEHTCVADRFDQLENRLVALEHLFEFLLVTINPDPSYAGISLPSLRFH
jgi:hypothetical protein